MKLYYATGTCSLSPHIVALEAGLSLDLVRVDIQPAPHRLPDGTDYGAVTEKSYVPALELEDGSLLTEGAAIVQYLADLAPASGLAPAAGSMARYRLQEWLTFIATELHKSYSPWLFHPEYGTQAAEVARARIADRLALAERRLTESPYLLGDEFTAADAYLFTIVGWSSYAKVDLAPFPALRAYMARIATRPAVRAAMRCQGMAVAA